MEKKWEKIDGILKELQPISKIKTTGIYLDKTLDKENATVVKGLGAIIYKALDKKASDIHIEPLRDKTRIRYRIDGILYEQEAIDKGLHESIVSRIKVVSELDITERKLPQDGKFVMNIEGKELDFRVSIVPLITGEKVVIRILDKRSMGFELENLGFGEKYDDIIEMINKKSGIILASGPTGSGKSSLIYAILKKLNSGENNISTVEDPVEYEIDGINQVQYNSEIGRDFATVLKSYLRQDPDILMIGEIRDYETAEIAVKSAMTGHLVLSTIHTNSAVSTVSRLINIGIEPYMISDSLIGVISQRLVRKLCDCKKIDEDWKEKLKKLNPNVSGDNGVFYTGCGCEKCGNTGYNGRLPIYEIFILDNEIREQIEKKASIQRIEEIMKRKNMVKLVDFGIEKAKLGETSLDEIARQV